MRFYESTARLEPRVGYAAGWIGVVESEGRIVERKVSLGEAGRASQFATFFANFWNELFEIQNKQYVQYEHIVFGRIS